MRIRAFWQGSLSGRCPETTVSAHIIAAGARPRPSTPGVCPVFSKGKCPVFPLKSQTLFREILQDYANPVSSQLASTTHHFFLFRES